jgi:hypothetical protein
MQRPLDANLNALTDIGSKLLQYGIANPSVASTIFVLTQEDLALFRQGGAWDYQRLGPPTPTAPTGTFVKAFTDFANVQIGAYAASIGMSLDDVLSISNEYAKHFSDFNFSPANPPDPVYTNLRATNVWDKKLGYSLYQSGLIGHQ